MDIPDALDDDDLRLTFVIGYVTRAEARIVESLIRLIGSSTFSGIEGAVKMPNDRRTMPRVLGDLGEALEANPIYAGATEIANPVGAKLARLYYRRNELIHSSWIPQGPEGHITMAQFFRLDQTENRRLPEFIALAGDLDLAWRMVASLGFVLTRAQTDDGDRRAGFEPEPTNDQQSRLSAEILEWARV